MQVNSDQGLRESEQKKKASKLENFIRSFQTANGQVSQANLNNTSITEKITDLGLISSSEQSRSQIASLLEHNPSIFDSAPKLSKPAATVDAALASQMRFATVSAIYYQEQTDLLTNSNADKNAISQSKKLVAFYEREASYDKMISSRLNAESGFQDEKKAFLFVRTYNDIGQLRQDAITNLTDEDSSNDLDALKKLIEAKSQLKYLVDKDSSASTIKDKTVQELQRLGILRRPKSPKVKSTSLRTVREKIIRPEPTVEQLVAKAASNLKRANNFTANASTSLDSLEEHLDLENTVSTPHGKDGRIIKDENNLDISKIRQSKRANGIVQRFSRKVNKAFDENKEDLVNLDPTVARSINGHMRAFRITSKHMVRAVQEGKSTADYQRKLETLTLKNQALLHGGSIQEDLKVINELRKSASKVNHYEHMSFKETRAIPKEELSLYRRQNEVYKKLINTLENNLGELNGHSEEVKLILSSISQLDQYYAEMFSNLEEGKTRDVALNYKVRQVYNKINTLLSGASIERVEQREIRDKERSLDQVKRYERQVEGLKSQLQSAVNRGADDRSIALMQSRIDRAQTRLTEANIISNLL